MRIYEKDGILRLRISLQFPRKLSGIVYNPNLEAEWNSEGLDFNVSFSLVSWRNLSNKYVEIVKNIIYLKFKDCLYEHREYTQFIAFGDWDDILMTPKFSEPLPTFFHSLKSREQSRQKRIVALFRLGWYNAHIWSLSRFTTKFICYIIFNFWTWTLFHFTSNWVKFVNFNTCKFFVIV